MRLIDADALWADIQMLPHNGDVISSEEVEQVIADAPTIEAEPVKHGRWIVRHKGENNFVDCSERGTVGSPFWKRCPMCEAKMDVPDINVGNKTEVKTNG